MNRYGSPYAFLTPPLLIVILPIIALLLLIFLLPSFFSISSQISRPTSSVKRSWDSINIFLVLFAILCGVFARRSDDESSPGEDEDKYIRVGNDSRDGPNTKPGSVSDQWLDQYDRLRAKIYDTSLPEAGSVRLKRNSSSYPDLRQESSWETGDDKFRVFDDFEISKFRSSAISSDHRHLPLRRTQSELEHERPKTKVIPVDTFVLRHSPTPPTTPPPPPPPMVRQKPRRTYQSVRSKERVEKAMENNGPEDVTAIHKTPPATPPPPPPQPPPPPGSVRRGSEQRYGKLERRKSNATKEIKMVLSSFIQNQRKRKKKQKTKNADISQDRRLYSPASESSPYNQSTARATPPPPPPPIPPPSVFHGLFRKASKNKRVHSVPAPPSAPPPPSSIRPSEPKIKVPPPPPPPPARPTPPRGRMYPTATRKPPLPTRPNTFYEENINGGNQSPLIPMPPPPPPPPFKMSAMRFVVRGGFVKIGSSQSSRCSSPELEDASLFSGKEESETASLVGGEEGGGRSGCGGGSVFCPSPDVNIKADTFIARLRDEWRLEKMNSMREKQKMVASA